MLNGLADLWVGCCAHMLAVRPVGNAPLGVTLLLAFTVMPRHNAEKVAHDRQSRADGGRS